MTVCTSCGLGRVRRSLLIETSTLCSSSGSGASPSPLSSDGDQYQLGVCDISNDQAAHGLPYEVLM